MGTLFDIFYSWSEPLCHILSRAFEAVWLLCEPFKTRGIQIYRCQLSAWTSFVQMHFAFSRTLLHWILAILRFLQTALPLMEINVVLTLNYVHNTFRPKPSLALWPLMVCLWRIKLSKIKSIQKVWNLFWKLSFRRKLREAILECKFWRFGLSLDWLVNGYIRCY